MSEPGDLPPTWARVRLGDVVAYGDTNKVEPTDIPAAAWTLELEDIEKDTSRLIERVRYADRRSKSTKNRFRRGDVLYGKLRPYLNKVLIADCDGYCTTEIVPIRPTETVDGRYLFYWLKHPKFLEYVTGVSHGLNMPRLGTDAGRNAPFILAPIADQHRVAAALDLLFGRLGRCQKRLDIVRPLLKRFREAVLDAAVSGRLTEEWRSQNPTVPSACSVLAEISKLREKSGSSVKAISDEGIAIPDAQLPESWTWCRVGEIATVQLGGTPSRAQPSYWLGNISWVSSGEVANRRIAATREHITQKGLSNSNAKIYPAGTVLIAMIGEGKTRGQSAILDIAACTNQNVAGLVFDTQLINTEYVWLWARSEYERTRSIGRGGNQPALNGAKVRALPVPLPPRPEQDEIVRRSDELIRLADRVESIHGEAERRLRKLVPAILEKAFDGALVDQDPREKPVKEVLERIWEAQKIAESSESREVTVSVRGQGRVSSAVRGRKSA